MRLSASRIVGLAYGFLDVIAYNENTYKVLTSCSRCGKMKWMSHSNTINSTSCGCAKGLKKRKQDKDTVANYLFNIYKRNAKNRNISWRLSKQEFNVLIFNPCFYCTKSHSMLTYPRGGLYREFIRHNGVDRLDSKEGYLSSNCAPCCKMCNKFKMARTLEDFKKWVVRVYEFSVHHK